jgi:hypothetical protein
MTINAIGSNIPIEITKGGTNATSFSTANGIVKYDGTSLVTSSAATLDASNRMTNTAQPAFLATLDSTVSNVTGNGAVWQLGTTTALTEVFDQGANFNTNGTFTAPVTGKYFLQGQVVLIGVTTITSSEIDMVTSNRTYTAYMSTYTPGGNGSGPTFHISLICDMDASDTAVVNIIASGQGANTGDVYGQNAKFVTFFSGYLVC